MIYTFIGELSLIDKAIEDVLLKQNNISIIKYDLEETSILKVLEDINTISLFDEKKVIICSNLTKVDDSDNLIKYLNNKNDNILILTDVNSLNGTKKLTKELKTKSNYMELNNIDLSSYIKESFNDYEITNLNISLLKDYCNNDFHRIKQETDKLKMYKLDDKIITSDDIKKVVKKGLDKNIFDLFDAINKKNMNKVFDVYTELIESNEDQIKLISTLGNNFKLIYKVKELIKDTKDEDCLKILKINNPYRFKFLKEQSYIYSKEELLGYIKSLSDLDIKIKSGVVTKERGLELFLASL